jgi:hypothetical protein
MNKIKSYYFIIFIIALFCKGFFASPVSADIQILYVKEGGYTVRGSIKPNEWKNTNNNEWQATLFTLRIVYNGKNFNIKGFGYDRGVKNYIAKAESKKSNNKNVGVHVFINGLKDKPGKLLFYQNMEVKTENFYASIKKDDFSINNKNPDEIKFRFNNKTNRPEVHLSFSKPLIKISNIKSSKKVYKPKAGKLISLSKPSKTTQNLLLADKMKDHIDNVTNAKKKEEKNVEELEFKKLLDFYSLKQKYIRLIGEFGALISLNKHINQEKEMLQKSIANKELYLSNLNEEIKRLDNAEKLINPKKEQIFKPLVTIHITAFLETEIKVPYKKVYQKIDNELKKEAVRYYQAMMIKAKLDTEPSEDELHARIIKKEGTTILYCNEGSTSLNFKRCYVTALLTIEPVSKKEKNNVLNQESINNSVQFIITLKDEPYKDAFSKCKEKQNKDAREEFKKKIKKLADIQDSQIETKNNLTAFIDMFDAITKRKENISNSKNILEEELICLSKSKEKLDDIFEKLKDKKNKKNEIRNKILRVKRDYETLLENFKFSVVVEVEEGSNEELNNAAEQQGRKQAWEYIEDISMGLYDNSSSKKDDPLSKSVKRGKTKFEIKAGKITSVAWMPIGDTSLLIARVDYNIEKATKVENVELLKKYGIIKFVKEEDGAIAVYDYLSKRAWKNVGVDSDNIGFRLTRVKSRLVDNWVLPDKSSLKGLTENSLGKEIQEIIELKKDIPYWISGKAKSGNPLGYCFGRKGNCSRGFSPVVEVPETYALAILLTKSIE